MIEDIEHRAFELRGELINLIKHRAASAPRSMQKELGPSDVAHPCMRRMVMSLMDVPRSNPEFDPLPSILGIATHAWLDSACQAANRELGRVRWLTETRVNPSDWLQGSSDLFDLDGGTVIDWKVMGASSFKKYKKRMNPVYRYQANLYGLGFERAGQTVNNVAIMLIPKAGLLTNAYLWMEPYNRELAVEALQRRDKAVDLLADLDIENHPERLEWLEKSGPACHFCKWFAPLPTSSLQCGGVDDDDY